MTPEHKDAVLQTLQATPAVTAVWAVINDLSIENWLGISGIIFLVLQAMYLMWKWRRDIKRERDREVFRDRIEAPETTDNATL